MAELKRLKATRAQIKGQVTRVNIFLTSGQQITCEQAQTRLERLQELWSAFNDTQTQIEVIKAESEADLEDVAQQEQGEREIFEGAYYKAVDQARSIIAAAQALALPALIPEMQQGARPEVTGNVEIKTYVKITYIFR